MRDAAKLSLFIVGVVAMAGGFLAGEVAAVIGMFFFFGCIFWANWLDT